MMHRISLASLFLLLAPATLAQETELPDLTPREFEIRGELQVSLPDLERQPLRGFAPPPRTYVVPADRQAHVAPYGQNLDELPDGDLKAPPAPSLVRAQPRIGQIDLLMGRYFARIGRLTVNAGGLGIDLEYSGHSGFDPFGTDAPPVLQDHSHDSDNLTGQISYTTGDAIQLNIVADGGYHEYDLMGARARFGIVDDQRTMHSLGLRASLRSVDTLPQFTVEAGSRRSSVSDQMDVQILGELQGQDEMMFFGSGSIEQGPLRLEGGIARNTLDAYPRGLSFVNSYDNASVSAYQVGGSYEVEMANGELSIGAGVAGFSASEENLARTSPTEEVLDGGWQRFSVGPVVDFRLGVGEATQFFARTMPSAEPRSQFDIYRTNPYVHLGPAVAPDVHLLDSVFGFEVQTPVVRFDIFGGARMSPNVMYFERSMADNALKLFYALYDEAFTLRTGANVTAYAPGDISVSAGVEYRRARLTDQDRDVPFVAPLSGRVSVAVPFSGARGLMQASLYAEGARPTEIEGETAPAWADLSLEAHYRLAGRFGLLVRADRLAGRAEQWPGFPQPPATITAGVRAGW